MLVKAVRVTVPLPPRDLVVLCTLHRVTLDEDPQETKHHLCFKGIIVGIFMRIVMGILMKIVMRLVMGIEDPQEETKHHLCLHVSRWFVVELLLLLLLLLLILSRLVLVLVLVLLLLLLLP
jgi:hypothetical protein